jgi:hypothetical protein
VAANLYTLVLGCYECSMLLRRARNSTRRSIAAFTAALATLAPVARASAPPPPPSETDATTIEGSAAEADPSLSVPSADSTPQPIAPASEPSCVDAVGPDVVRLRDGGWIRGTIVESRPSSHVVIVACGKSERLSWDVVESIEGAPAPATESPADTTYVHIETRGKFPVHLYRLQLDSNRRRRPDDMRDLELVCEQPCDREVRTSAGDAFVLGGPKLTRTNEFSLHGRDRATISARGGRIALRRAGFGLFVTGLALLGVGGILVVTDRRSLQIAGGVTAATGLATLATSVGLVFHGFTRYELRWGK